jgi:outer membrane immunogenic protein
MCAFCRLESADLPPRAHGLGRRPWRRVLDTYGSAFSWSGLYIGANVGHGWSQVDWQDAVTSSNSANQTGSGWLAGAQIGYNWQWHQLVLGVEADASGAWVNGSTSCQG